MADTTQEDRNILHIARGHELVQRLRRDKWISEEEALLLNDVCRVAGQALVLVKDAKKHQLRSERRREADLRRWSAAAAEAVCGDMEHLALQYEVTLGLVDHTPNAGPMHFIASNVVKGLTEEEKDIFMLCVESDSSPNVPIDTEGKILWKSLIRRGYFLRIPFATCDAFALTTLGMAIWGVIKSERSQEDADPE